MAVGTYHIAFSYFFNYFLYRRCVSHARQFKDLFLIWAMIELHHPPVILNFAIRARNSFGLSNYRTISLYKTIFIVT